MSESVGAKGVTIPTSMSQKAKVIHLPTGELAKSVNVLSLIERLSCRYRANLEDASRSNVRKKISQYEARQWDGTWGRSSSFSISYSSVPRLLSGLVVETLSRDLQLLA
jgi:hypothetical protein